MRNEPQIESIYDNKVKQKNYQKLMAKYSEAINNGYYGEAELIVYAFLEDRLRSMLYYLGAVKPWNRQWLVDDAAVIAGQVSNLNDMSTKIEKIRKILKAAKSKSVDNSLVNSINEKLDKNQIDDIVETLKNIENWKGFRNEIVHSLFNKNIDELYQKYSGHVKNGYDLGRNIDKYINILK